MLHESTQQLIRKLYELTDASALAWKEAEGDASRLETEGYVVEVQATPATLRLLRADGRELERADEAALAAVAWPDGEGTYATRVTGMATRAQRVARGAEHAIAKILSSLSSPPKATDPAPPSFGSTESFDISPGPDAAPPAPHAPPALATPSPVPTPPTSAITPTPAPAPAPAPIPPAALAAPAPKPASPPVAPTPIAATPVPPPAPVTAAPAPVPQPAPAPRPAPDMLAHGISARSVQGVESASPADVQRAIAATTPPPAPPAAPKPAPTGPDIYKPWS